MLNEEQIRDIANWTLRHFNCNRKYKVMIAEGNSEDFSEWVKEKYGIDNLCIFDVEHGRNPKRFTKKNSPCQLLIFNTKASKLEGQTIIQKGKISFVIAIWKELFCKFPLWFQVKGIIHEARHIVEYPHIFTEEESGDTDFMLLKQFLDEKEKEGILRDIERKFLKIS